MNRPREPRKEFRNKIAKTRALSMLKILNLEDNLTDSELMAATLSSAGIDCEIDRVETGQDFIEALGRDVYDLIISDFSLPSFDGRRALDVAKQTSPGIPFIFFSGTIGEDSAIESLLNGATDY